MGKSLILGIFLLFSTFLIPQAASAQTASKEILVLELGCPAANWKAYGMYLYWPGGTVETILIESPSNSEKNIKVKTILYQKINELVDLGWELIFVPNSTAIVDNSTVILSYIFEKTSDK